MTAIMRRELLAYFSSPIGYIFIAVFYSFSGYFFFGACLYSNNSDLSPVFSSMFTIVLFLIPILTMRLFSEDKKHKTDQALLTAPVSLTGLVMGKFLAAVAVFFVSVSITLIYALVISIYTVANWALIFGNFIGILLLGMALISIGMLISSMTDNQVVAAIGGFASALILILMDSIADLVSSANVTSAAFFQKILMAVSFFGKYTDFTLGKLDLAGIVFFLSVSAVFVFLTVRVLEKRRWS